MALSLAAYDVRTFEQVNQSVWASNSFSCNADSMIIAINMIGKSTGTPPTLNSVSNNKGLTFTRRRNVVTSIVAGNQCLCEYWYARAPSALTGLVVSFNWSAAVLDRGTVLLMEIRGILDWANPFAITTAPQAQYLNGTIQGHVNLSINATKSPYLKFFYMFSKYLNNGVANGTMLFNGNSSPGAYIRHCLARDASATNPFVFTYSGDSYIVLEIGDAINGAAPVVVQSRPVVVLTG